MKFFHLLDSQVSMSVITKHRSSSIRLNRVAREIDVLGAGFRVGRSYVQCEPVR